MKSIYLKCLKYGTNFKKTNGSYYDFVVELFSESREKEVAITEELRSKGWRKIKNGYVHIFVKDRHVIRLFRMWEP